MKTDLYTKVILTVIALALTINLVKDFTLATPAYATPAPIPTPAPATKDTVYIGGVVDVNITQYAGKKCYYGAKEVSSIPVLVKNIQK